VCKLNIWCTFRVRDTFERGMEKVCEREQKVLSFDIFLFTADSEVMQNSRVISSIAK
jgi:hypothetical protein